MMHKTCLINYGHLADLQKTLPTTDLNQKKKTFHLIKYLLATFISFLSFQSVLVFLVFIQGSSSSICLFADDCLVYREIRSKLDCSALQSDLDNLVQWSKTWGMEFNISKCKILSVTNVIKTKIKHQYTMDGQAPKIQDSTEYLGANSTGINTSIISVTLQTS